MLRRITTDKTVPLNNEPWNSTRSLRNHQILGPMPHALQCTPHMRLLACRGGGGTPTTASSRRCAVAASPSARCSVASRPPMWWMRRGAGLWLRRDRSCAPCRSSIARCACSTADSWACAKAVRGRWQLYAYSSALHIGTAVSLLLKV